MARLQEAGHCFSLQPMKFSCGPLLAVSVSMVAFSCLPVLGQQGAVSFKHFRVYPQGQWSQEIQAYREGVAVGPPQKSTTCAGPLSAAQAAAVKRMGNDAAPMCRMDVLKDEETVAEYEQTCNIGSQQQVIHSTMRSIDDHTMAIEVRHTVGGHEMSFARITSRYEGVCTAQTAPTTPGLPAMPKPSAEQCAALPAMKSQVEVSTKGCASEDMPAASRASCLAAMKGLAGTVQQMEAQCK